MEQPHAQVLFELSQRLTRGLRCHALGRGRLPQAAQLGRFHEGGDGTQFIDGHGVFLERAIINTTFPVRQSSMRP